MRVCGCMWRDKRIQMTENSSFLDLNGISMAGASKYHFDPHSIKLIFISFFVPSQSIGKSGSAVFACYLITFLIFTST